jgi:hypothetical protein
MQKRHTALKLTSEPTPTFGRRKALHSLLGNAFAVIASVPAARALDMDAFANSQVGFHSSSVRRNSFMDPARLSLTHTLPNITD